MKLDQVNESTRKLGEVVKKSNSENNREVVPIEIDSEDDNNKSNLRALRNSNKFSTNMMETLGAPMKSKNTLKLIQDDSARASILGIPIHTLGGDRIRINDDIYDLTPEIYKALSYTGYTAETMKKENDILMMYNIINDLGYTSDGDRDSKRKTSFTKKFPKLVEDIQNRTFDDITYSSDDLQGEGVKIIIPSNIVDIYTRSKSFKD